VGEAAWLAYPEGDEMSRRIQRDTHKRVSSTGYQKMQGDLEVQGHLLGPEITKINAAIAKVSAVSTTPVKLGAPMLEGIMRGIEIRWGRQYNLANFSHYELQVSDDDESWYSLLLDGTGWKGNLNEDTDVRTEVFTHANIPLREDAGDLVGISLYYRVRQVTLSEVSGEWSDSTYATTKGVQDVVLTDSRNRYIEISSKKGIYADDRQGHVIHDIPNSPIVAGMAYGGHIIWVTVATFIANYGASYTDVQVARTATGATTNTSLAAHLPAGLTNIRGAAIAMCLTYNVGSPKVHLGTDCTVETRYSLVYNVAPTEFNIISTIRARYVGADHATTFYGKQTTFSLVPVAYNGATPYITWNTTLIYDGMSADNSAYSIDATIYLLGVTV
jgi:hypothetical protein